MASTTMLLRYFTFLTFFMQNYGLHNIKTKEDFESFKKDKAPSAVFFYHQENENEPLKSKYLAKAR